MGTRTDGGGCAKMGAVIYANPTTGAFGGSPYGATEHVRSVPHLER